MGLGRGWACIGLQLITLRVWGWGGVGHALGFNSITLRLGPGYKDRPTGAGSGRVGRVGPVRAEWGWGVHWDSIK